MEEEIKDEVAVDENVTAEEESKIEDAPITPELTENQKRINKENEDAVANAQKIAEEIFDVLIKDSELPYMCIELVPQFLKTRIEILKGKSEQWGAVNKAMDIFYVTPIKDLKLLELKEETDAEKIEE